MDTGHARHPGMHEEMEPIGSRYLIIPELGLKDHDYYGFGGLSP